MTKVENTGWQQNLREGNNDKDTEGEKAPYVT